MSKKKKEEYIGSFDIGTRIIKLMLAKVSGNSATEKVEILNYSDIDLHPWNDSDEYTGDLLEELLSRAEARAKLKNVVYKGFPISVESTEALYAVKEITITKDTNASIIVNEDVLQQINKDAIRQFEEMHSEGRILADYIIGYKIDGKFYPNIIGKDIDVLNVVIGAIYVPNKLLNSIEKYFDILDIGEYVFEYSPISAAYFIPTEAKNLGCLQIHGSWQEFDLIYWYNDKILSMKKLPYGMRMLSKDVEKVFKVNRSVAENLIFNDFKSIKEEDISEGVINVTLKNGEESEISRQFFQRVLEARMDEISEQLFSTSQEISENIRKEYEVNMDLSNVYLTGSFLNLKGVKNLLFKYFKNSHFYLPSVEDVKTLVMGEKTVLSDISNLSLMGNLINYSNEVLIKSEVPATKGIFGIFSRRKREENR